METNKEDIWETLENRIKQFEKEDRAMFLSRELQYTKRMMWFAWVGWVVTAITFLVFNW